MLEKHLVSIPLFFSHNKWYKSDNIVTMVQNNWGGWDFFELSKEVLKLISIKN